MECKRTARIQSCCQLNKDITEFDRTGSISPNIDDLLCAVDKETGRQNKSAVVVFDEFQEIADFDDDEIERKMRSVFQSHRNVSYIFMGSKTHLMRDIFNNPNRSFYKSGKHFPLSKIDHEELGLFAKKKFSDHDIVIDNNELKSILNNTECHPYYFQMLCNVLWELCMDSRVITESDIAPYFKRIKYLYCYVGGVDYQAKKPHGCFSKGGIP